MRKIEISEFGPPEVMQVVERPGPTPGPGEVIVAVLASGVLTIDTMVRAAKVPPSFTVNLPWTPGQGAVGEVRSVGSDVPESWIGQRVLVDDTASYADEMATTADRLRAVPSQLSSEQAIGLMHDGGTALGLWRIAQVEPEHRVLIAPAGGGAGSILSQLAVAAGCRVIGVVGSDAKARFVRGLGVQTVLNHREAGWLGVLEAQRPTVTFDGVGGDLGQLLLDRVAPGGTYINYGGAGGRPTDLAGVRPDITVVDISVLGRLQHERAERQYTVMELGGEGKLVAHIGGRFSLEDAPAAHRALNAGEIVGKALIVPVRRG